MPDLNPDFDIEINVVCSHCLQPLYAEYHIEKKRIVVDRCPTCLDEAWQKGRTAEREYLSGGK